jgi:hypothetical protein
MEHEFVPGKRRCRICHQTAKFVRQFEEPCDAGTGIGDIDEALAARGRIPAPEPQVWHLNVWTSVNGVIFAVSAEATEATDGPDIAELMVNSVLWCVNEIKTDATPAEE